MALIFIHIFPPQELQLYNYHLIIKVLNFYYDVV